MPVGVFNTLAIRPAARRVSGKWGQGRGGKPRLRARQEGALERPHPASQSSAPLKDERRQVEAPWARALVPPAGLSGASGWAGPRAQPQPALLKGLWNVDTHSDANISNGI